MSDDWQTREIPYVTLIEAAEAMGVTTARLRHSMVDGPDEGGALARRLGMFKLAGGRDWLIPRERLLAELDRRARP
jgi:hypothetical protein